MQVLFNKNVLNINVAFNSESVFNWSNFFIWKYEI